MDDFNGRGPIVVEFDDNNASIPPEEVFEDTYTFTFEPGWTAELVGYADPEPTAYGQAPHCPEAGSRLEVHGDLHVHSDKGVDFVMPVLLSSPTSEAADASLVHWSHDLEDGLDAVPIFESNPPLAYSQFADAHPAPSGGWAPQMSVTLRTDHYFANGLADGARVYVSRRSTSRATAFLAATLDW